MSRPERPIISIYHDGSRSLEELTEQLLETSGLEEILPSDRGSLIGIKPNLVVARPAHEGGTTHPEIVAGIIRYLTRRDYRNLMIVEGSWVGDRTSQAFRVCGYEKLSKEYAVPLFDTQKDSSFTQDVDGYPVSLCSITESIDFLINVPLLKGHCQTRYTGALKNLKGLIPDSEKRRFHSRGLHEPIARLNQMLHQDCIVMDAICPDPTFEEGGDPSDMNRILFATDPVLIDSYGASVIGYTDEDIPYIGRSEELHVGSLWDGSTDSVLEINDHGEAGSYRQDEQLRELETLINEKEACSSCYAALIRALRQIEEPEAYRYAIGRFFRTGHLQADHSDMVGIGVCTQRFSTSIPGCPPSSQDIVEFLTQRSRKG